MWVGVRIDAKVWFHATLPNLHTYSHTCAMYRQDADGRPDLASPDVPELNIGLNDPDSTGVEVVGEQAGCVIWDSSSIMGQFIQHRSEVYTHTPGERGLAENDGQRAGEGFELLRHGGHDA